MTIKFIGRTSDEGDQTLTLEFPTALEFAVFLLLHHLHWETLYPGRPTQQIAIAVADKEGGYQRSLQFETVFEFLLSLIVRGSNEGVYDFSKDVVIDRGKIRKAEK